MSLIFHRGLNCHLASVVSVADTLGLPYRNAFVSLWSETDFFYDPQYHICQSKRVLPNLESLGMRLERLSCASPEEAKASAATLATGELFLIGIDAFHVPWSPRYRFFREAHYLYARKQEGQALTCFDPTYQIENAPLPEGDIIPHAFDLVRVSIAPAKEPLSTLQEEAQNILRTHPQTKEKLHAKIRSCHYKERNQFDTLIKQITAMINNRHLFQKYLQQHPHVVEQGLFEKSFLSKWEAVKNGLYKAAILAKNEAVIKELCILFLDLMQEEMGIAKALL